MGILIITLKYVLTVHYDNQIYYQICIFIINFNTTKGLNGILLLMKHLPVQLYVHNLINSFIIF